MRENYVLAQLANVNQFDISAMLASPLISPQVINHAKQLHGKRQKQFITCRYLLAELLNDHYGISCLPLIIIGNNQRPQFEKTNLPDFNISHSGDYVAVAICSNGKIGIDIEQDRPRKQYRKIAAQFFSEHENTWLNQQTDGLSAFWQLWTLREAALKLYAKSVWQMKELQLNMQKKQISASFADNFYYHHQPLEQIYLSICCEQPITQICLNQ
ncbi:4'-phosphopantetheinyl transferase superfamily protein [Frischella sp. Ac48]|uniref:4'-phosphopantetheinyl transferase family protein n=1 Tax=Frischella sp. Ac48 TaxID=2804531 RepID=UPI001C7CD8BB|nr:4'-phosphopantetheinyl transferase superfamily protein [Frischella sp. Ac48]MBX4132609.1 4'-phosphopantetheinyl transferase superfamily protein [Frischella sp. Ac48]